MENLIAIVEKAERKAAVLALKPEQVARVYSGKPGCGCGCKGKYSANPAFAKVDDTINMAQVKRVLAKVQAAAAADEPGFTGGDGMFAFENETRYLWVYLPKAR